MSKFTSRKNWTKKCLSLLFFLALFTSSVPVTVASVPPLRIEPELLKFAAAYPETTITVIMQKSTSKGSLEADISQLGGKVTKNLSLINAVAADLPANQLHRAAQLALVRWISLDAPVVESGCNECINTSKLANTYNKSIKADLVWNKTPYLQGQGITVAVVDSGVQSNHPDLANRVIAEVNANPRPYTYDGYGHGTFVAGIIAGNGAESNGSYIGIAPKANLIDVKVTTIAGMSTESDVIVGLQWIYENHARYNIRVVNLSFNSSKVQSYHTSPLNAAVEVLWFNGIVVIASAGNQGEGALYPPANDPFIITVGATDENNTLGISDDVVASFSAYGKTSDGYNKPDLVAPGRKLVGTLASPDALLAQLHPANVVNKAYLRMSGTSAAAPVVAGAIALLLQDEPSLNPDQVKYRLMATANKSWAGYDPVRAGAGYLDIEAAVQGTTSVTANTGLPVSNLLTTGPNGVLSPSVSWSSVSWSSVSWSSVSWSSVSWSSVSWSSVSWSSDYWEADNGATSSTSTQKLTRSALDNPDMIQSMAGDGGDGGRAIYLPVVVLQAEAAQ